MDTLSDWLRLLSLLSVIATLVLIGKLYFTGLAQTYRWFTRFLAMSALAGSLLLLPGSGNEHAVIWACLKPMEWLLSLAVLLEIYSLVMARYPGIASMMRWAAVAAAGITLTISIMSLSLDFMNPHEKFPVLRYAFAVQRTVELTLALSLVIPWLLIMRFPIRLCRNVVVHCALFSASAALEAMTLLARNILGSGWNHHTNLVLMAGSDLCLLGWILFLNKDGEQVEQVVRPQRDPAQEEYLIGQLHAFNQALLHAVPSANR